jgi:hypothetical protein
MNTIGNEKEKRTVTTLMFDKKSPDAMRAYDFLKQFNRKQGKFVTALILWFLNHKDSLYYNEKEGVIIDVEGVMIDMAEIFPPQTIQRLTENFTPQTILRLAEVISNGNDGDEVTSLQAKNNTNHILEKDEIQSVAATDNQVPIKKDTATESPNDDDFISQTSSIDNKSENQPSDLSINVELSDTNDQEIIAKNINDDDDDDDDDFMLQMASRS